VVVVVVVAVVVEPESVVESKSAEEVVTVVVVVVVLCREHARSATRPFQDKFYVTATGTASVKDVGEVGAWL
jgi:hypothetical protein